MDSAILVQQADYVGTHAGAVLANRAMMESLGLRGWRCRVIVPDRPFHHGRSASLDILLKNANIPFVREGGVTRFQLNGVTVEAVAESTRSGLVRPVRLREYVRSALQAITDEYILVASEDHNQRLLQHACEVAPERTVLLARSILTLGLGPGCFFPNPLAPLLLQKVAGVIVNSHFLGAYIKRWGKRESLCTDVPTYGEVIPFADRPRTGVNLMINPCALKGIDILLALVTAFPGLKFAVIPTWGTTAEDKARLASYPNVAIRQTPADGSDIFHDAQVLLVPSLCEEAFGRVVVEGMARGIPTLASNLGGLPEAKCGVPYLLPVTPITQYRQRFDTNLVPVPQVPPQTVQPWCDALHRLHSDVDHYADISRASWSAATNHIRSIDMTRVQQYLEACAVGCSDSSIEVSRFQ